MNFLGAQITQGWIQISPEQIKVILEILILRNKKQLCQALGIFGVFRKHIRNYWDIAKPLTRLTGDVPFTWTELETSRFKKLQEMAMTQYCNF